MDLFRWTVYWIHKSCYINALWTLFSQNSWRCFNAKWINPAFSPAGHEHPPRGCGCKNGFPLAVDVWRWNVALECISLHQLRTFHLKEKLSSFEVVVAIMFRALAFVLAMVTFHSDLTSNWLKRSGLYTRHKSL